MKRVITLAAGLLVCLWLAGCGPGETNAASGHAGTPAEAFKAFQARARHGDWEAVYNGMAKKMQAYSWLSAGTEQPDLRAPRGAAEFAAAMKGQPMPEEFLGEVTAEFGTELSLRFANGSRGTAHMVREKGEWKLLGVDVNFEDVLAATNRAAVGMMLMTIRSQIKLHDEQNPGTAYTSDTPVEAFWEPLIRGKYLVKAPLNPLQNNSSTVAGKPAPGVAWVWGYGPVGLTVYAVDEHGGWLDETPTGTKQQ